MWEVRPTMRTTDGNVLPPAQDQILALGGEIRAAVKEGKAAKGLEAIDIPMLWLNQLVTFRDAERLVFVFNSKPAPGIASEVFLENVEVGPFSGASYATFASKKYNVIAPVFVAVDPRLLSMSTTERAAEVQLAAESYLDHVAREIKMFKAHPGYEHLQSLLDKFHADHPDHDKNVFLIMRFQKASYFQNIAQAIDGSLTRHGLKCLRADQKIYPSDGDLWNNVCTYMMGCKYGIAVFEDIDERNFNPNISIEYGFMRAHDKRVLLLKEKRLQRMPTDIVGKLYRDFDQHDIELTIAAEIDNWVVKDLHLK